MVAIQWQLFGCYLVEADMGFPDRIERTMELAHPLASVWAALTTAEGLAAWFGEEADIDLRPGGAARMTWANGYSLEMRVERVEEPTVFGFTWQIEELPDDDPRRTYVEFTLEPVGAGTRLTVVESGFAQLPEGGFHEADDRNTKGWESGRGELVDCRDAACHRADRRAGLRRAGRPEQARHPRGAGLRRP